MRKAGQEGNKDDRTAMKIEKMLEEAIEELRTKEQNLRQNKYALETNNR